MSAAETKADRASLTHVEPGRRAHGLDESPLDVVQAAEAITRANEGVSRGGIDKTEPLQVPEVEDEVQARSWGVPCIRHAQCFKSLGFHLTGDSDRWVLTPEGLGHAIAIGINEHWLLEVRIEPRCERAAAVGIHCGHRRRVPAVEFGEEGEDEVATSHTCRKGASCAARGQIILMARARQSLQLAV